MAKQSHKGLVLKEISVKRGGKTFKQKRWVKGSEDDKVKPEGKKSEKFDPKFRASKEDFVHKLKTGDLVNVGNKILKVKTINKKSKTVLLSGTFGNETYDFDELNHKGVLETPEGKFKPDLPIKFMGKDLTIKKVSKSQKTVKLSDGKVYTMDAIDKGSKIKTKESAVKDLKVPKKKKEIQKSVSSGTPITEKNAEETLKIGSQINIKGEVATITNRDGDMLEYIINKSKSKIFRLLGKLINDGATVYNKNKKKKTIKDLKIDKNKLKKSELSPLFNEDGFIFKSQFKPKVLIKFNKAANVNTESGESGYVFSPKSYDKEDREFEDKLATDMDKWIMDRERDLRSDLKSFYDE